MLAYVASEAPPAASVAAPDGRMQPSQKAVCARSLLSLRGPGGLPPGANTDPWRGRPDDSDRVSLDDTSDEGGSAEIHAPGEDGEHTMLRDPC